MYLTQLLKHFPFLGRIRKDIVELMFDYEYHRESEAKIVQALTQKSKTRSHCHVPLIFILFRQ
jgi:hypothetical protein